MADGDEPTDAVWREQRLAAERVVRNRFQYLWPATHALAWIIARDDDAVNAINAALDPDADVVGDGQRTAWESLIALAEQHRQPGDETCHNVLWRAFDELARALQDGRLLAWQWDGKAANCAALDLTAFMPAGLFQGENSCGLLGVGRGGATFVLMRAGNVRDLWRGRHVVSRLVEVPVASHSEAPANRAPAVKSGRPPCEVSIVAKAREMKARGMNRDEIAKKMRFEPGFENVATTDVRDIIKGKLGRGRPPKNRA